MAMFFIHCAFPVQSGFYPTMSMNDLAVAKSKGHILVHSLLVTLSSFTSVLATSLLVFFFPFYLSLLESSFLFPSFITFPQMQVSLSLGQLSHFYVFTLFKSHLCRGTYLKSFLRVPSPHNLIFGCLVNIPQASKLTFSPN